MDVTEWLLWFGNIVLAAQAHSTATIEHLIFKMQLFDRLRGQLNTRQEKVLVRLFDAGPEGFIGGLSAKDYMTITDTTPATARRDLVDLVNKHALKRTGERKGTRYWLQWRGVATRGEVLEHLKCSRERVQPVLDHLKDK